MGYSPWRDLAERQELTSTSASLPAGSAWYFPDELGIVLDRRLQQSQRRSALAHELAHVDLGHVQTAGDGPTGSRAARRCERQADQLAAERLITVDQLVEALLWSQDERELAEMLWVDVATVRARLRGLSAAEHKLIDERLWAAESRMP